MSEYGIKIKNIEGASLYENNIGVRNHFDYKDAMLTNSLFHDFLKANGLNVYKGKSTRDIICIEFNFGTRSYEEEIKHIEKMIEKTKRDTSLTEENREQKLLFFDELKKEADRNKDKYKKITKEELREELGQSLGYYGYAWIHMVYIYTCNSCGHKYHIAKVSPFAFRDKSKDAK